MIPKKKNLSRIKEDKFRKSVFAIIFLNKLKDMFLRKNSF